MALFAAPVKTTQISEDAQWYLHIDVEAANNTELLSLNYRDEIEKAILKVSEFKDLDFKPNEDVHSITLYGNYEQQKSVLIIEGKFDEFLISNFVESKVENENINGLKIFKYKNFVGVIYNYNTIIIANNLKHLESGMQVISGNETSLSHDSTLIQTGNIANGCLTHIDKIKSEIKKLGHTVLLKAPIETVKLSVDNDGISSSSKIQIVSNAKTTEQIYDVFKGIRSYLELNIQSDSELQDLLKIVKLSKNSTTLTLEANLSNSDLVALIAKKIKK